MSLLPPKLYTVEEAASYCQCSKKTIYRAIVAGQLPKRTAGVALRFSDVDLARWMQRLPPLLTGIDDLGTTAQVASPAEPLPERESCSVTTRRPTAALGVVQTPHGDVIVRKKWRPKQISFILILDGPHLALRWMLPSWIPTAVTIQTQLTPAKPMVREEEVANYYLEMHRTWRSRFQSEGDVTAVYSPAANSLPYATLGELRQIVEAEMQTAVRPSTLKTYRHQWKAVFQHLPESTQLLNIDRTRLQDMVTALSNDGLKPETVRKDMQALKRLLTRAVEDGIYRISPLTKVRLPKKVRRPPRFLTLEQRASLLRVAQAHSPHAHLLIALGVYLGLRKAELLALQWSHVDLDRGVAQVVNTVSFTTKSGRNRAVPICDDLKAILAKHRRPFGYVLSPLGLQKRAGKRYRWDFRGLLRELVKTAGIPTWCTTHTLRHTFASLQAQAGVSLYKIAVWMGHSTTEMTEIYAHLAAYDPEINRGAGPVPKNLAGLRILDKSD